MHPTERLAESLASLDLTSASIAKGTLLAIAQFGAPGSTRRTRSAAKALADSIPTTSERPQRPEVPGTRLGVSPERPPVERDLTASEIALLGLLGNRRDDLTEAEANQVQVLAWHAKSGTPDRALVDYVLAPSIARQQAQVDAAQLAYERALLAWLPATLPPIPMELRSAIANDLAEVIRTETPELTEGEALQRASRVFDEARKAAEAEFATKRENLEASIAALSSAATASAGAAA